MQLVKKEYHRWQSASAEFQPVNGGGGDGTEEDSETTDEEETTDRALRCKADADVRI